MSATASDREAAYSSFSGLMMNLPDETFINHIMSDTFAELADGDSAAQRYLTAFQRDNEHRPAKDVLLDIARDRTQLLRGVYDGGIRPPYESLYTGIATETAMESVEQAYHAAGLDKAPTVTEPAEYLGCELAFMAKLCHRENEAVTALDAVKTGILCTQQKNFFTTHLDRWACAYADEVIKFAQTDFYRGIAELLKDFLNDERNYFETINSADCPHAV